LLYCRSGQPLYNICEGHKFQIKSQQVVFSEQQKQSPIWLHPTIPFFLSQSHYTIPLKVTFQEHDVFQLSDKKLPEQVIIEKTCFMAKIGSLLQLLWGHFVTKEYLNS
jgi:hypothetical protein